MEPFVLLNHLTASEHPAWDVVIDARAEHHIDVAATAAEAKAATEEWLRERYSVSGEVVWEPAGDSAFIGRWTRQPQ